MVTKERSKAIVMAADGKGGMAPVEDLRFEGGEWPIQVSLTGEAANLWATLLLDGALKRKWSTGGLGQLDPDECSGSQTIRSPEGTIEIVWSHTKRGTLQIQARSTDGLARESAEAFVSAVAEQCRNPVFVPHHRRFSLQYSGLPWQGELWLDEKTRLGPPSQQFKVKVQQIEMNLFDGPRTLTVDLMIDGLTDADATARAKKKLQEISIFLGVVLGTLVREVPQGWAIALKSGTTAPTQFELVQLGYLETGFPAGMPARGHAPGVPEVAVDWTKLMPGLFFASQSERAVPQETTGLWSKLASASDTVRRQFFQAGRQYQAALILGQEAHPTTAAALMVAVCEALKPIGQARNKRAKASVDPCDVVGSLLGDSAAKIMRDARPHPDGMRDSHLHNAEVHGGELDLQRVDSTYHDLSFRMVWMTLCAISQLAILQWLSLGGQYELKRGVGRAAKPSVT